MLILPRGWFGTRLALPLFQMDLENALDAEMSRLFVVADAASREIAANRPWWVGALVFLRQVVL